MMQAENNFTLWLRFNQDDRDRYAQAKRRLAKNKWRYVQHYADAKTSIIREIVARADKFAMRLSKAGV